MDKQYRCYIASSNELAEHIKELLPELEKRNIYVTSRWWEYYDRIKETDDFCSIAYYQFRQIEDSDFLILFGDPDKEIQFNGANIELGFAIGKLKKTFSVFRFKRSLMHYIDEPCYDIPELLEQIDRFIKYKNGEDPDEYKFA